MSLQHIPILRFGAGTVDSWQRVAIVRLTVPCGGCSIVTCGLKVTESPFQSHFHCRFQKSIALPMSPARASLVEEREADCLFLKENEFPSIHWWCCGVLEMAMEMAMRARIAWFVQKKNIVNLKSAQFGFEQSQ